MTVLLVAVGGAVGAAVRFLVDDRVRRWSGSVFPWATLLVNAVGSLILGFLTGAVFFGAPELRPLLGTGLCGALTTFSTFGADTVGLLRAGEERRAVINVAATIGAGLASGAAGLWCGATW